MCWFPLTQHTLTHTLCDSVKNCALLVLTYRMSTTMSIHANCNTDLSLQIVVLTYFVIERIFRVSLLEKIHNDCVVLTIHQTPTHHQLTKSPCIVCLVIADSSAPDCLLITLRPRPIKLGQMI